MKKVELEITAGLKHFSTRVSELKKFASYTMILPTKLFRNDSP